MRKSALIDISAQHFHSLQWEGPMIKKGNVFCHLGYPLGVNVTIKDKVEWVLRKIRCKLDLWHAGQWPFHVRVRIVQAFLQPYVMYFLLLSDWRKCHFHIFESLLKNFLWNKKHSLASVLSSWKYTCQPKVKGGLGILDLHSHTLALRTAFIMHITASQRPLWKSIEMAEICYTGNWKLDVCNKFFSHAPLKHLPPTLNCLL
ncbi:hypothetical protein KP509_1Z298200 [Ceratopteris richardii]|nr:hypothetical protein KP509_1Z298200 [Ceratopteris richardii]